MNARNNKKIVLGIGQMLAVFGIMYFGGIIASDSSFESATYTVKDFGYEAAKILSAQEKLMAFEQIEYDPNLGELRSIKSDLYKLIQEKVPTIQTGFTGQKTETVVAKQQVDQVIAHLVEKLKETDNFESRKKIYAALHPFLAVQRKYNETEYNRTKRAIKANNKSLDNLLLTHDINQKLKEKPQDIRNIESWKKEVNALIALYRQEKFGEQGAKNFETELQRVEQSFDKPKFLTKNLEQEQKAIYKALLYEDIDKLSQSSTQEDFDNKKQDILAAFSGFGLSTAQMNEIKANIDRQFSAFLKKKGADKIVGNIEKILLTPANLSTQEADFNNLITELNAKNINSLATEYQTKFEKKKDYFSTSKSVITKNVEKNFNELIKNLEKNKNSMTKPQFDAKYAQAQLLLKNLHSFGEDVTALTNNLKKLRTEYDQGLYLNTGLAKTIEKDIKKRLQDGPSAGRSYDQWVIDVAQDIANLKNYDAIKAKSYEDSLAEKTISMVIKNKTTSLSAEKKRIKDAADQAKKAEQERVRKEREQGKLIANIPQTSKFQDLFTKKPLTTEIKEKTPIELGTVLLKRLSSAKKLVTAQTEFKDPDTMLGNIFTDVHTFVDTNKNDTGILQEQVNALKKGIIDLGFEFVFSRLEYAQKGLKERTKKITNWAQAGEEKRILGQMTFAKKSAYLARREKLKYLFPIEAIHVPKDVTPAKKTWASAEEFGKYLGTLGGDLLTHAGFRGKQAAQAILLGTDFESRKKLLSDEIEKIITKLQESASIADGVITLFKKQYSDVDYTEYGKKINDLLKTIYAQYASLLESAKKYLAGAFEINSEGSDKDKKLSAQEVVWKASAYDLFNTIYTKSLKDAIDAVYTEFRGLDQINSEITDKDSKVISNITDTINAIQSEIIGG